MIKLPIKIYALIRKKDSAELQLITATVDYSTIYQLGPIDDETLILSTSDFNYLKEDLWGQSYVSGICGISISDFKNIPQYMKETRRQDLKICLAIKEKEEKIQQEYDVIAFSHHRLGRKYFCWEFGKDITFEIETNFGYGFSSRFHSYIRYKNCLLVQYSQYIKTPFYDYTGITGYSYSLKYSEWYHAMKDCMGFYNNLVSQNENYIFKWLTHELSIMIDTFKNWIHTNSYSYIEAWSGENQKLTGDYFWYYKSRKIAGSLEFIEDIKNLPQQINPQNYIDELIQLYKDFQPQLEEKIKITHSLKDELQVAIDDLQKEIDEITTDITQLSEKIDNLEKSNDYFLYSILNYKTWGSNNFKRYWFLIHLLKEIRPDCKLSEIKAQFFRAKDLVTEIENSHNEYLDLKEKENKLKAKQDEYQKNYHL